jgi:hypothetical protein
MNGDQDAVTRLIVSSEEGNNLSKSFLAILYLSDTGVKKDENKHTQKHFSINLINGL